ncbi:MAG: hypothetical protein PWQ88_194 [Candidatus Methanomethylophilaceae archaeon]|nr:hypothetical protein [Candidatus Methanomethylophilaceae archaeon]
MNPPIDISKDVIIHNAPRRAEEILSRMWGGKAVFTCTIGNTLTSTIPGVSDAGDTPELTLYTPSADVELLVHGRTICMDGIPINPGGIPTPATVTMAALALSEMPFHIINGGVNVLPHVPYFDVGGKAGRDIRTGEAVSNVQECYEKGLVIGDILGRSHDFLVASESCAGGTTTALAVLRAMGIIEENLVSSSSPNNPKELKDKIVSEALKAAGAEYGDLRHEPLEAIRRVGDSMMPANLGLVIGAARRIPVILGGGTQMVAVLAAALEIDPSIDGNVIVGTTRWLINDRHSDIVRMVKSVGDIPLAAIQLDYKDSPYEGLRAYEEGYVKEGVGCGGSAIAAVLSTCGEVNCERLLQRIHEDYKEILKMI